MKKVSTNSPDGAPIPMQWQLCESGNDPRDPDAVSSGGNAFTWHLSGTPGTINYKVQCTVNPPGAQAPGDYGKQVTVNLVPML